MDVLEVSIHLASSACATEIVVGEIQREIQLADRERTLLELERRWKGGEQWPQTSKTAWLISNLVCAALNTAHGR